MLGRADTGLLQYHGVFDKDGETITETMNVLSPAVRAAHDLMPFMAVFGNETIFREGSFLQATVLPSKIIS